MHGDGNYKLKQASGKLDEIQQNIYLISTRGFFGPSSILFTSNEKNGRLTARFTDMCLPLRFQLALVKRGLLKITHTYVDFPFSSYSIQISRCIFVRQDKVTFVIPIMRNNFKACVKNSSQPSIFLYSIHR